MARRFQVEVAPRKALTDDDLEIHLQPIVDAETGRLSGLEALARWSLASPSEFIPVAEEAGLIAELGTWALNEALGAAVMLAAASPRFEALRIGVNVSADQLLDLDFAAMVFRALERHGVAPEHVVLELTESILISHGSSVVESSPTSTMPGSPLRWTTSGAATRRSGICAAVRSTC